MSQTLANPELRAQLLAQEDADTVASTPEQLGAVIRAELGQWGRIIKTVGIKPE